MLNAKGKSWKPKNVDMDRFRAKMKNMARMVHDYPELKGMIGDLHEETRKGTIMAASSSVGGTTQSQLYYNHNYDSTKRDKSRDNKNEKMGWNNAADEYTGNHELGHVLNSLLFDANTEEEKKTANADWHFSYTADKMLDEALSNSMSSTDYNNLSRHGSTDIQGGHLQNQIDMKASQLHSMGQTSRYGMTDASEFFAEAVADVYAHGENARKASIEIMKIYERMMQNKKARSSAATGSGVP